MNADIAIALSTADLKQTDRKESLEKSESASAALENPFVSMLAAFMVSMPAGDSAAQAAPSVPAAQTQARAVASDISGASESQKPAEQTERKYYVPQSSSVQSGESFRPVLQDAGISRDLRQAKETVPSEGRTSLVAEAAAITDETAVPASSADIYKPASGIQGSPQTEAVFQPVAQKTGAATENLTASGDAGPALKVSAHQDIRPNTEVMPENKMPEIKTVQSSKSGVEAIHTELQQAVAAPEQSPESSNSSEFSEFMSDDESTQRRETAETSRVEFERSDSRAEDQTQSISIAVAAEPKTEAVAQASKAAELRKTFMVEEHVFSITKVDATSIEVSLHPEGMGRIEIELKLDGGMINARISAADSQVREMLQRNLTDIVNALTSEGYNVGGFSVGLSDRRSDNRYEASEGRKNTAAPAITEHTEIRSDTTAISIFV